MAGLDFSVIRELGRALSTPEEVKSQTKKAIVREVTPDGVVVEVGGSGVLTPVESSTATYSVGDVVQVTNRGGRLTIGGNATAPSVGAGFVRHVVAPVAEAVKEAAGVAAQGVKDSAAAQKIADEAQAVASALQQHFWSDTSGIHVTESTQEDWEDEPTGHNILINSLGVLLRNALLNSVSITDSATAFFDGLGNAAGNIVARFGRDGAQIGKSGESHMELDYHSLKLVDLNANEYFNMSDLRGTDGKAVFTDTWTGDGSERYFNLSNTADDTSYDVTVNGSVVTSGITRYTGAVVFATAPANGATISVTYYSTSQSAKKYTIGTRGEGSSGSSSVAIGRNNIVPASDGIAIGVRCKAKAPNSIAVGLDAEASGYYSKSIGWDTIAARAHQTAIGKNNEIDTYKQYSSDRLTTTEGKYALIIGNGTDESNRSNAFAVDWDGYIYPMAEKMADWVVAQGTSGIWTYRKWHSGIAECWGNYTASMAVNVSSAAYGGYRSNEISVNLPSGLFTAWPNTNITFASSGGIWVNNMQPTSATKVGFFLSCGSSQSAASRTVSIQCIGKWK